MIQDSSYNRKKIIDDLNLFSSPSHGQIIIITQASPISPNLMQGSILALRFQPNTRN
jgi:hypothetical protein